MAKPSAVPTPHDRLVRRIFARPETAAVLLRRVVPREVLAHLDLGRIDVLPASFVGQRLGTGFSDLVYAVGIRGSSERAVVFATVEHQSWSLRLLPLRMFWYVGWLWDRDLASKGPCTKTIPMILPIVMVQSPAKWNGPIHLSELYDVPSALRQALPAPIELKLWVDDMGESVLDDPVARPEVLALVELTRALLFAYHHPASVTEARIEVLAPLFDTVLDYYREDAEALWTYVVSVFGEDSPLRTMLLNAVSKENRTMVTTIKDAWLAEGMNKGMAKGMVKGMASALLQMLEYRELTIPAELQQQVLATDDEPTLRRWIRRALVADSIERVFEPVAEG